VGVAEAGQGGQLAEVVAGGAGDPQHLLKVVGGQPVLALDRVDQAEGVQCGQLGGAVAGGASDCASDSTAPPGNVAVGGSGPGYRRADRAREHDPGGASVRYAEGGKRRTSWSHRTVSAGRAGRPGLAGSFNEP